MLEIESLQEFKDTFAENSVLLDIEQKIIPNFKRPLLNINNETKSEFNLNLNLNLPKDIINLYVSNIKDEYDKNKDLICSPHDILAGNKSGVIDFGLQPKRKGKSSSIQHIWADRFFVYDYYSNEKMINEYKPNIAIYKEIDTILVKYHADDEDTELYWYNDDTYRKNIIVPMKELIKQQKYMALIN